MISVIVPVYNVEKYLESCVESILRQDFSDFELLLVDDGSKDGSAAICDRYAKVDGRVRCFHRHNSGVGNARNFGIDNARGEWICFIDADDEVCSNYLSAFDTDNTAADIVIAGIDFINTQTNAIIRREKYAPTIIYLPRDKKKLILFLLIGFSFSKIYRRNLLYDNKLRFPTDINFHEDHVFVFDCYLNSRIIEIKPEVTYLYRIDYSHPSLSKKKHEWQKHWAASNYMIERIVLIKSAFGYNDAELRSIHTFAYEPVISAVYDLYDSGCKRAERIAVLRKLLKGKLPISKYYFPMSTRGKIVKLASLMLPIGMLDAFFVAVNRYQNRSR